MVAGVVAALDNEMGVVGVAPEVELYSVKVLDQSGNGTASSILSGIEWAIDNNMQVINISFGGPKDWPSSVTRALEKAYQAGIVIVAGAGNSGDTGTMYAPARFEPVIAVGALDQHTAKDSRSCTGSTLELMAPGVDIMSTSRGGGYSSGNGTSYSTAHVTGTVALLIAHGVTNNVEVRQILQQTAGDLGPAGWDSCYGYGNVNAVRAISHEPATTAESEMPVQAKRPVTTCPPPPELRSAVCKVTVAGISKIHIL